MELGQLQQYFVPGLLLGYFAWRFLRFRHVKGKLPTLLREGAVIVDVRSRGEYAGSASPGSVNIPLDEIERGIRDLDPLKPVVLCCASGSRSAMAASILRRKGFKNVVNAGPWQNTLHMGG